MPNARLAYEVLDDIDSDPHSWDQRFYIAKTDCGTAACFAGRAVLRAGAVPLGFSSIFDGPEISNMVLFEGETWEVPDLALHLLSIFDVVTDDREDLFDATNTREDLGRIVEELFGPRPRRHAPKEQVAMPNADETCGR